MQKRRNHKIVVWFGERCGNQFSDFDQVIDVRLASGPFAFLLGMLFSGKVGGFEETLNGLRIGSVL